MTIYKPAEFRIDFYGNITCGGNLIELLEAFAVITDKKTLEVKKIPSLTQQIGRKAVEQFEYFRKLPFEQTKRKTMEAHVFGLRQLFDLAGLSWKPNRAMYKSIKGKKLHPRIADWGNLKSARQILKRGLARLQFE